MIYIYINLLFNIDQQDNLWISRLTPLTYLSYLQRLYPSP